MRKKIKLSILFLMIVVLFSGCDFLFETGERPHANTDEIWVCKKPYIYLSWNEEVCSLTGIAENEEIRIELSMLEAISSHVGFEKLEDARPPNEEHRTNYIFTGEADYEGDHFFVEITNDNIGFFGGELPTLRFDCYKKEEYIEMCELLEKIKLDNERLGKTW